MCADGETVIFECFVILANNPYTYIGLCDTRCKKCWDVSFPPIPPHRTFSILQPGLASEREEIYKDIFWIETEILTTPWRKGGGGGLMSSMQRIVSLSCPSKFKSSIVAVHYLNLDAQLVHSVTDEPFIHLYKYNWHNKFAANREPVAVWQEVSCRAEYTWDTYPHLSLISELLLQLSQPSMPQNELFISPQQGKFPFQSVK